MPFDIGGFVYDSTFIQDYGKSGVITDGLVLYLDAGFAESYPKGGTTWYDLSGNGYNGTLTNGPTYSSVNGGGIAFDGSNDYVDITSNLGIASNIACTLDLILKVDTNTSSVVENPIIRIGTATTNQMRLLFMRYGNFAISYYANDYTFNYTVSINTIYNVTFIENGSGLVSLYINGVLQDSSSLTAPNTSGNSTNIGRWSTNTFFNGDIYNVKIYNRALSSTEITQNYNALKGRFGL